MSTNKTLNYNLHAWEPGDDFLRAEMNENFAALDAGAVRMLFGTYTGAADSSVSTPQRIEVGVAPRAVFIFSSGGCMGSNGYACLTAPGYPIRSAMPVDDSGFTVVNLSSDVKYNVKGYTYHYLVLC